MSDLVVATPEGLYCPAGGFHIDPWRPVERAVLTHAHADHARPGHAHVLASATSAPLLRARLGDDISLQTLAWGEPLAHGGVTLSLHPAGHVLGSAQLRLEHAGRVWVAAGDYRLAAGADDANPTCEPFEPVRCDVFVTESTFALPIYRWPAARAVFAEIDAWWAANAAAGRPSLLMGYALGKAQRLLAGVDPRIGPILVHGAVETVNAAYRAAGVALPPTRCVQDADRDDFRGALVVAPPGAHASAWARRFVRVGGGASDAFASGWMQLRGARRRRGVDRGFVLSDHADWPGLLRAIRESGASRVLVTHGHEAALVRWLREAGLEAEALGTELGAAPADVEGEA